jgi:hypothetical protein
VPHAVALQVEHLEVERDEVAVGVAARAAHVEGEARLSVGRGRQHHHVVDPARALDGDQLADVLGADVPAGERRHLPDRLVLEQPDDRVDVLAPERVDVLVEQHLLRRRELSLTVSGSGCLSAITGVGALEGELTAADVVSSASAVSAAVQRSTSRRISTARWRGGRCWRAAMNARRMVSFSATRTAASGTGSEPRDLVVELEGVAGHLVLGAEPGRAAAARRPSEVGEADVRRDPVQPGTDRGAALERVGRLPRADQGLLTRSSASCTDPLIR